MLHYWPAIALRIWLNWLASLANRLRSLLLATSLVAMLRSLPLLFHPPLPSPLHHKDPLSLPFLPLPPPSRIVKRELEESYSRYYLLSSVRFPKRGRGGGGCLLVRRWEKSILYLSEYIYR